MNKSEILVTGGTGYIGSHACVALIEAGHQPLIVDNLANSRPVVLDRIARITGYRPRLYVEDVRDPAALLGVLRRHQVRAAMHFAGLKAVGESVEHPLRYYATNVEGTLSLVDALANQGVRRLIFSSSATVYGVPRTVPITESAPVRPTNPYGHSKAMAEQILRDTAGADPRWRIGSLRYFNPVGAHPSGLLGEDPLGMPNNLMPYLSQVAVGKRPELNVFGNDYPTPDGTGVRDYLHVMDLAEGHVAALNRLLTQPGLFTVNLGTGTGYSVLDVVRTFEAVSGQRIPLRIGPRRPGDVAVCYADPGLAEATLGWRSRRGLEAMCRDAWRWQTANPMGYVEDGTAEGAGLGVRTGTL